jgi:phage gpG-like protein
VVGDGAYIDLTEVDRALADLEARAKRLAPAFRELRKPLRLDQRDHARGEMGPGGKWPARSPLTEERRRAKNRRVRLTKAMQTIAPKKLRRRSTPNRLLGRLPAAVIYKSGELFVRATSRVAWSGVHQEGGSVGRGSRIPARPFLWLSDAIIDKAKETLAAFVVKGWTR